MSIQYDFRFNKNGMLSQVRDIIDRTYKSWKYPYEKYYTE